MAESLYNLPPQVVSALQRGNLVEAIKILRQHRPQMGLAEAKALIDALQKQANVKVNVKTNVTANVRQAAKPQAAPMARASTPHAHHAPNPHAGPAPSMDPHVSPGEVPRTSNTAAFVAVVVAIVVVIAAAEYFSR